MTNWPTLADIRAAAGRIEGYAHRTPVLTCSAIDSLLGTELFFKCENFQKIGAFKFRGALNSVLGLDDQTAARGVATHSSGNHGAAIALAARMRGIEAHIVMPANANAAKIRAVKAYGGHVIECGPTLEDRDIVLRRTVEHHGAAVIHPYNDYRVITGQGTAALELLTDVPDLDVVVAPVGGGGLLSGTALAAREMHDGIRVIACEPSGADDAFRSLESGELESLENPQTIADGLKATLGTLTFPIIRSTVDQIVLTSEEAIVQAMRLIWERMKIVVEPSAAVALAGLMDNDLNLQEQRVGVILTGGNVDLDNLPW